MQSHTQLTSISELSRLSNDLRVWIIDMLEEAKSGHPGGSLSAIDFITALWFGEMKGVDSPKSLAGDRDHFVLSKGHAVPALYAVLAKKGFMDPKSSRLFVKPAAGFKDIRIASACRSLKHRRAPWAKDFPSRKALRWG